MSSLFPGSDGERPPESGGILLAGEQIASLFPFHVAFNAELRVVGRGRSLGKVCPELGIGDLISDVFELERPKVPFRFEELNQRLSLLFLLKRRRDGLRLRGQLLALSNPDRLLFLASPWLPEPGMLRSLGLTLDDFPLHDAMPELLLVVQSQSIAMDDLKRLTEKLSSQRQELRAANQSLQAGERTAQRLALIAARTDNSVIITDAVGRIEWVNESFEKLTGFTIGEVTGKTPGSFLQGKDSDPEIVAYMKEKLVAGEGFHAEIVNYSKTGRKYWVSIEVQPIRDDAGTLTSFMAIETDISERREWEQRNALALAVTRILAAFSEFKPALEEVLKTICTHMGFRFASLWRRDPAGQFLASEGRWIIPELRGCAFETVTKEMSFALGVGLPGETWLRNELRWLPDLATAGNFARTLQAAESGLNCGLAFPVSSAERTFGVLELFGTGLEAPTAGWVETLIGLGQQIQQFAEQREADQQRAQILALLDSTLESTAEGILVTDLSGNVMRANRRWREIFEVPGSFQESMSRDELLAWIDPQFKDQASRQAARQYLFEHSDEPKIDTATLVNGAVFEIQSTPHRMGKALVGRVWTYRDITESHRAYKEREQILATLNATLEATTDGILVSDLDQNIVAFNQRFLELWRIPPEKSHWRGLGQLRSFVASQVEDPVAFNARSSELYNQRDQSAHDVIHFVDGRVYERDTQPQRVGEAITGRVSSYRDVTQRWRADEALRESEERYRIVAETASDAILTFDADQRILLANPAAERMFGCPVSAMEGRHITGIIPDALSIAANGDQPPDALEVNGLRGDGTSFPLEATIGASKLQGQAVFTVILRDITQRKEVQKHLQRAIHDAEAANRAKGDFLANVSHEIRTPLNAMVGFSELLDGTPLDSDQREMLGAVRSSSESLLHLINDLLDLSKIDAGQVDLESVDFDPVEVGEQAIEIISFRAAGKGLKVFFVVDPPMPPRVAGDVNRLRQILLNLLSNAIKFTQNGSVAMRLGWSINREGTLDCCYTVEDSGIGIEPELQAKVFDKFFRIDSAVGRQAGGVGLGLSISRMLCDAMGGTLGLSSEPGRGSQFSLRLSFRLFHAVEQDAFGAPLRVLLLAATDAQALTTQVLESLPAMVLAFTDGEEALTCADRQGPFDWVVVDDASAVEVAEARTILRLASLGHAIRMLRIRRNTEPSRFSQLFPDACEVVDFPLTPARITRRMLALLARQLEASSDVESSQSGPLGRTRGAATVLLVEDNLVGQAYARRVLEREGHIVTVSGSGADAIACASRERYDVILMDVMLPDMTGFLAARAIRDEERQSGRGPTPIVALTAHALEEYRQQALWAGMDDYVSKPVRPQVLLAVVERWKSGTRAVIGAASSPLQQEMPTAGSVAVDPDLADLVPAFIEKSRQQLTGLEKMEGDSLFVEARRVGHNLKGTGSLFGFQIVSQMGTQIEEAAVAKDELGARRLARELALWLENLNRDPSI